MQLESTSSPYAELEAPGQMIISAPVSLLKNLREPSRLMKLYNK